MKQLRIGNIRLAVDSQTGFFYIFGQNKASVQDLGLSFILQSLTFGPKNVLVLMQSNTPCKLSKSSINCT